MKPTDAPVPRPDAPAVPETDLPYPDRRRGKVRDVYTLPPERGRPPRVLIVATDRISAFDVVLPTLVPGKGVLLTEIAVAWFRLVRERRIIPDHLLSTDPADLPGLSKEERDRLRGRIMIGRAAKVIPVECVVRGYLTGSGWEDYRRTGSVCGIPLPSGLRECDRLPEPIFTPATKAEVGHDENIAFERAAEIVGEGLLRRLRDATLEIYRVASERARERGIIIADTKFEFGFALDEDGEPTDEVMLIDEALTPDSSRFWPAERYEPGHPQPSFDKQYVREYLLSLVNAGSWDKTDPGPELPPEIVANTLRRYREAKRRLFE